MINNKDYNPSQIKRRQESFLFFKVEDISLTQELGSKLVLSSEMSWEMRWFTKIGKYKPGPPDRNFLIKTLIVAHRAKSLLPKTSLLKPHWETFGPVRLPSGTALYPLDLASYCSHGYWEQMSTRCAHFTLTRSILSPAQGSCALMWDLYALGSGRDLTLHGQPSTKGDPSEILEPMDKCFSL